LLASLDRFARSGGLLSAEGEKNVRDGDFDLISRLSPFVSIVMSAGVR